MMAQTWILVLDSSSCTLGNALILWLLYVAGLLFYFLEKWLDVFGFFVGGWRMSGGVFEEVKRVVEGGFDVVRIGGVEFEVGVYV